MLKQCLDISFADRVIAHVLKELDDRDRHWWKFVRAQEVHERSMILALVSVFRDVEREVLGKVVEGATISDMMPDDTRFNDLLVDKAGRFIDEAFRDGGQTALSTAIKERNKPKFIDNGKVKATPPLLPTDPAFNVLHEDAVDFLRKKEMNFSFAVRQTTKQNLRKQLEAGIEAGETLGQLKKRVRKTFASYTTPAVKEGWQIQRIARTETVMAYNGGTFQGYEQSGVVEMKEWVAVRDLRTRSSHNTMDGKTVPLKEYFVTPSGTRLMYPADPSASGGNALAEIINCRCTTIAVIDDEAELPLDVQQPIDEYIDAAESDCMRHFKKTGKEHAIFLDSSGKRILDKTGKGRNQVVFNQKEFKLLENANVGIHNHPSDASFSPNDLRLGAELNIKEMRVITHNYEYIYKPSKEGWKKPPFYEGHWNQDYNKRQKESELMVLRLLDDGNMSWGDAEEIAHEWHTDRAMQFVQRELGGTYIRRVLGVKTCGFPTSIKANESAAGLQPDGSYILDDRLADHLVAPYTPERKPKGHQQ